MSQFPIFRFKLDLTGNKPENRVTYELVHLSNAVGNRTIVPKYGAFYAASLKIRQVGMSIDANALTNISLSGAAPLIIGDIDLGDEVGLVKYVVLSNQLVAGENGLYAYTVDNGGAYTLTSVTPGALLTPSAQYKTFMLNQDATRMSGGKFVDQLIVLSDESVQGWVILEYQAVGGIFSTAPDVLEQLITILDLDNRPVNWHDIVELPAGFNPTPHYHHSSEYFGYGGLISAIERMYLAVINLNNESITGLNRTIFPPIQDYTGPVYDTSASPNVVKKGTGGILTYLGKITPITLEGPVYSQSIRLTYLTTDAPDKIIPSNAVQKDVTGIIEGDITITFTSEVIDFGHALDLNNLLEEEVDKFILHSRVIRKSGDEEPRTKFYLYPNIELVPGETTKYRLVAFYMFEVADTNRGPLCIYSDELPEVLSWSNGAGRAKLGFHDDITFDNDVQSLIGYGSTPVYSVAINAGVIDNEFNIYLTYPSVGIEQNNRLLNIFDSFKEENEYVLLHDVADAFNSIISDINTTAAKMEKQIRIVSEVSYGDPPVQG